MIPGLEGRHMWVPPGSVLTPAAAAEYPAGMSLHDYIVSLNPELYWTLGPTNGLTDQSGNGRHGTAQGGVTIGGSAALTADPDDAGATNFDGSDDYIDSGYTITSPGGAGLIVIGWAWRDTQTTEDYLWSSTGPGEPISCFLVSNNNSVALGITSANNEPNVWPGTGQSVFWASRIQSLPINAASSPPTITTEWSINADSSAAFSQGTWDDVGTADYGNFRLAASSVPANFFDGKMSHVAVFPAGGLSSDEWLNLYLLGQGFDPIVLNHLIDDDGNKVWPRYKVKRIGGLHGLGDSGDTRDLRVGQRGEIPRRSFRRGKTITYEGLIKARTRAQLRQAEADLRAAFDDQTDEGLMVVTVHPDNDDLDADEYRYFTAKALTVEIDDVVVSPHRDSLGHESSFVVAVRNKDGLYYDQDDASYS